jgi:hypothetical protein
MGNYGKLWEIMFFYGIFYIILHIFPYSNLDDYSFVDLENPKPTRSKN